MKIYILVLFFFLSSLTPALAAVAEFDGAKGADVETEFIDPFDNSRTAPDLADPLEPLNRAAFWLNDKIYSYLLKPACRTVSPELLQLAGEWMRSLDAPVRIGAAELDFKFRDAGSEIGRFLLHGILGMIGHLDPQKTAVLAEGGEDFGRVFEELGAGPGFYVVLPVTGPSTLREGIGKIAGLYLDPSASLLNLRGDQCAVPRQVNLLGALETYESIQASTLDPYLVVRDAFSQLQEKGRKKELVSRAGSGSYSGNLL